MQRIGIDIVVALVVGFAVARAYGRFHAGQLTTSKFLGWVVLWLGVLVVGLQPHLTDRISQWLGVERGATLFMFVAVLFLFYLVFTLHVRIERQQRELTDLVRKLALRDDERDKTKP